MYMDSSESGKDEMKMVWNKCWCTSRIGITSLSIFNKKIFYADGLVLVGDTW